MRSGVPGTRSVQLASRKPDSRLGIKALDCCTAHSISKSAVDYHVLVAIAALMGGSKLLIRQVKTWQHPRSV